MIVKLNSYFAGNKNVFLQSSSQYITNKLIFAILQTLFSRCTFAAGTNVTLGTNQFSLAETYIFSSVIVKPVFKY
jgi:hypothetical protein